MEALVWLAFTVLVLGLLALDLGVLHRRDRVDTIGEAVAWSAFWFALALCFNLFVYFLYDHHWLGFGASLRHASTGGEAALEFFTGFLLEKSLSVDHVFVIALVFAHFGIPLAYQHRVLFWGILGAISLRGLMIAAGAALLGLVWWTIFVFGALLLITAVKLLVVRHDNLNPHDNLLVRFMRRHFLVTDDFHGTRFFVNLDGMRAATPLLVALLVVETSGAIFAVNSIPAVFAITGDPFLVYTSNVFAVLGLRSLYFALAGTIQHLRYVKMSLAFMLAFVGVKMLFARAHPIPTPASLGVIGGILFVGISASVLTAGRETGGLVSPFGGELEQLMAVGRRQLRRIAILIGGSTVVVIGLAMIVLPGPAFLVIPAGLGILALEFVWARRWLVGTRRRLRRFPWFRMLERQQRQLRERLRRQLK